MLASGVGLYGSYTYVGHVARASGMPNLVFTSDRRCVAFLLDASRLDDSKINVSAGAGSLFV
jgi:hypothetical protein